MTHIPKRATSPIYPNKIFAVVCSLPYPPAFLSPSFRPPLLVHTSPCRFVHAVAVGTYGPSHLLAPRLVSGAQGLAELCVFLLNIKLHPSPRYHLRRPEGSSSEGGRMLGETVWASSRA